MAAPVLTETTYGFRIVGGTDATILKTDLLNVRSFLFFPDANSGTVAITDGDGNAIMTILGNSTSGYETQIWVDGYIKGLGCDFSGTASVLLVFLN
jgi:hypothetical protein